MIFLYIQRHFPPIAILWQTRVSYEDWSSLPAFYCAVFSPLFMEARCSAQIQLHVQTHDTCTRCLFWCTTYMSRWNLQVVLSGHDDHHIISAYVCIRVTVTSWEGKNKSVLKQNSDKCVRRYICVSKVYRADEKLLWFLPVTAHQQMWLQRKVPILCPLKTYSLLYAVGELCLVFLVSCHGMTNDCNKRLIKFTYA